MSASPTISIILPVYNPGGYLDAAVESVLAQSFEDFELLLIDDGSTDGSSEKCDAFALRDSRVRVQHGRNGGICASRNVGLSLARGEWLAFCDHDDVVEPNWLEAMLSAACREGVDLVKCNHTWQDRARDGRILTKLNPKPRATCTWTLDDLKGDRGYCLFMELASLVWDGLYRRSLWTRAGLRFDTRFKHGGEDCYIGVDLVKAAGRGVWLGDALYHHYFNYGVSTASRYHPDMAEVQLTIAAHERDVLGFSRANERLAMFKRWSGHLRLFVFEVPGCPLSLSEQASLLAQFYDRMVGRETRLRLREVEAFGLRVLACFMRLRLFKTWLVILRVRRVVKRLRERQSC